MSSSRSSPIRLDNYKPLREAVFEAVRDAIISGKFKPGERLMEVQLAEEMGVSRTPVREAIRKLELEGFVKIMPHKGAYVAKVSIKDIIDVFEVRAALEALAARLAAKRITEDELKQLKRAAMSIANLADGHDIHDIEEAVKVDTGFHDIIYKASRNEKLVQFITHLREQMKRFRATSLALPGRTKMALEEHEKIVQALWDRNEELAAELSRKHIENAERSILEVFKNARGDLDAID
ncbi:GntR family transcriptional regulator [Peptococcaceae bacterium]|nr:GntR family transcriptional regulator [Peptococcaceae bacterium]